MVAMQKPLRAEILSLEGLAEHAQTLAEHHRTATSKKGAHLLYSRFKDSEQLLQSAYDNFSQAAQNKESLSSGAEWLLDNYHIIKEQVLDIKRDFPRGYFRVLPKLTEGEFKYLPRVYHIALEIVAHTDASFDEDTLALFVNAYQTHAVLSSGELWAIPIMLRFALIENLRRLAEADLEAKQQHKVAEDLVQEILGNEVSSGTDILLMLANKLQQNPDFLTPGTVNLMRRLRQKGPKAALTLQWLEERLKEQGHDPEEISRTEQRSQAANQISVGNSVTSLRRIKTINWKKWFEAVSVVHQTLLCDPTKTYGCCDFATRDSYRHQIEVLSRKLKISELKIARQALGEAEHVKSSNPQLSQNSDEFYTLRRAHVGFYLFGQGLIQLRTSLGSPLSVREKIILHLDRKASFYYTTLIFLLTIGMMVALIEHTRLLGATFGQSILVAIILGIPLSDLASNFVQWLATKISFPVNLPKLDFEAGVPDNCRTAVTLQVIFTGVDSVSSAVEGLEVRYLANDDPNIVFVLLADLKDSKTESADDDQEIIALATNLVTQLNQRHFPETTGRFFLFFRKRLWNAGERRFMGWERKRGKVSEFNRLLLGQNNTTLQAYVGNPQDLIGIKYVITLDSDSRLPRGVGKKLIGASEHILNRPVFDPLNHVVIEGYGIIQPRIGVALTSAQASRFSDIFCGHAGLDPYTQMVSDVYQDLFHEGSYVGKGIYDVRAFEQALHNRVPENALLSHDLFEGCFARVALASDLEIFDNFPAHYYSYAKRLHRWVRGDWQIFPWIFSRIPDASWNKYRSPLSLLSRWKLFDNLRRSLVAPSCFLFLILAFTALPGDPLSWILLVLIIIAFPVYARIANALIIPRLDISVSGYAKNLWRDLLKQSYQAILTIVFLPYQAFLMLDAIAVTLARMYISKHHLLEWEAAHDTERRSGVDLSSVFRQVGPGIGLAFLVTITVALVAPGRIIYALPFIALWTFSPFLIRWLSGSAAKAQQKITNSDRNYLYDVGWETWRYFDELMNAEHNSLPPDNIQLVPQRIVAERTSPTNISLAILSTISAYDLGYSILPNVVSKLEETYRTLSKMERFHGHFLNWYQTKTLTPLEPKYISFVDSGNLVGHFIAARSALIEFGHARLIDEQHWRHLARRLKTISDQSTAKSQQNIREASAQLAQELSPSPSSIKEIYTAIAKLKVFLDRTRQFQAPVDLSRLGSEMRAIVNLGDKLEWLESIDALLAALRSAASSNAAVIERLESIEKCQMTAAPTFQSVVDLHIVVNELIEELSDTAPYLKSQHLELLKSLAKAAQYCEEFLRKIDQIREQTTAIVDEIDLAFLYDNDKGLFSIGYHIDSARRDNSFYDLLASESRLGSFVAIALGQVPQKHWFTLGRSLVDAPGGTALVSWSATMFEYLMPLLVMQNFAGTLLARTCTAAVKTQEIYAKRKNVPWGISESAYSGVDFEKTYQYKAFGVPALGLKRGLADDVVVSPYSTFLALMVSPIEALKNLLTLEKQGMRGEFGFYEAVDYTRERLSSDEDCHIVQSFLSHHQGMSLIAINNALNLEIMQHRFHSDPWVRSTSLLLHERFPDAPARIVTQHVDAGLSETDTEFTRVSKGERFTTPHTRFPRTRILSNGRYTVMLDNAGNGCSLIDRDIALTRWREDGVAGQSGVYIFIRDLDDGKLWSVAYQPTRVEPESYEVLFNPDKVEFKRRDFGIFLHTEITVSPEDNVEIRKVTLTNLSAKTRNLEITSYAEVALGHSRADLVHPVFSKMFIESEYNSEFEGLIFSRRPRSKDEQQMYLMHMLTMKTVWEPIQYESSRAKFLGRGNRVGGAAIMEDKRPLSKTVGEVLDPIFALRTRLELKDGQSESAVFTTGFARSREEILTLGQRYHDLHTVNRAFEMAWSHSNVELRHEQFSIRQSHAFQRLASALFYNIDILRGSREALVSNKLTQSALWRFGVSGDLPIVLLRIDDPAQIKLVQELLLAHQYIRMRGISFDLVIVNEYPGGYFQTFQEELEFMIRAGYSSNLVDKQGGIYLRTRSQISAEEVTLLEAISRVVLLGGKGPLSVQLRFDDKAVAVPLRRRTPSSRTSEAPMPIPDKNSYEFFNGVGGFIDQGAKYQIEVRGRSLPPLPWANVIANPNFGFLITESGGGYTWSENSRENKLTPWSNDAVSDPCGEVIYIRDADQGNYWSATPRPIVPRHGCKVRHGVGHSQFLINENAIESNLIVSGSHTEKVKWWNLKLSNRSNQERRIEVYLYIEWTLGVSREESSRHLVTDFDQQANFLHATNNYNNEFAGRVVAIGSNLKISSYTTSRIDFIGRHRGVTYPYQFEAVNPQAFTSILSQQTIPIELSKKVGSGFDSCGVIKVEVNLTPAQEREVLFFLNETRSLDEARQYASRHRSLGTRNSEFERVKKTWDATLSSLQIKTPDRSFDIMMNSWLLYQTLSCRIYGRSGFYQSGGAIGFRDQLQDSLALLFSRSELTREQIILHSSRQFVEGDVQHWWHPPTGRGVRTRISDDYLWLPYAVCRYLEATNDYSILDENVFFIEGPKLDEHQMESYILPYTSQRSGTVYEHCVLALEHGLNFGAHGLPLMGAGDWNDGMNEVGREGRGESVWLAWFLSHNLKNFSQIARKREDLAHATKYEELSKQIQNSVEVSAWDGNWYRRAYFDDGTPLGSSANAECRIDSISQSWSVIADGKNIERRDLAMDSVRRELVRRDEKIICLLTPPFDKSAVEPGYIKGYLPGTRENGAQYTHAAVWVVMATALQRRGDQAFELFSLINPINHSRTAEEVKNYQGEPYVIAGDVYSIAPHVGRAGWSWYTGSASWMYQVGIEYLLGLKLRGDHFMIDPVIPSKWNNFSISYVHSGRKFKIEISNPENVEHGISKVVVNGALIASKKIYFEQFQPSAEGEIKVEVLMGKEIKFEVFKPSDNLQLN